MRIFQLLTPDLVPCAVIHEADITQQDMERVFEGRS